MIRISTRKPSVLNIQDKFFQLDPLTDRRTAAAFSVYVKYPGTWGKTMGKTSFLVHANPKGDSLLLGDRGGSHTALFLKTLTYSKFRRFLDFKNILLSYAI